MRIARVIGNVIATVKHPDLRGAKLLVVDEERPGGGTRGRPQLALDTVDAGEGDRVLVVDEGNAAAQVLGRPRGPVRTVVVGVVDDIDPEPRDQRRERNAVPIYEYRCDRCGRVYEEWVGHGAPAPGSCPACGHEGRVRVPSRFAIPLSGAPGRAERAGPSCACARGGSCGCAP